MKKKKIKFFFKLKKYNKNLFIKNDVCFGFFVYFWWELYDCKAYGSVYYHKALAHEGCKRYLVPKNFKIFCCKL